MELTQRHCKTLQALNDAGVPEELIPEWYHRLVTLSVSLVSTHAATNPPTCPRQNGDWKPSE